ncbi:hypothetical protein N7486_001072, partial [Penicillium sp. IBT 16267x]
HPYDADDAIRLHDPRPRTLRVYRHHNHLCPCNSFRYCEISQPLGHFVRYISWDDYTIVLAWVFAFGVCIAIDLATKIGLGKHDADIRKENVASLGKYEYVFSVLYNPALMAAKTSILIVYLRISKGTVKVLYYASWLVLGMVNIAGIVLTFINIFQCRPIAAAFKVVDNQPECIDLLTQLTCSSPVNIVTNLAILALPLPIFTRLMLPRREKIILVFTFAVGVFVTVVDVLRIYYLQQAVTNISIISAGLSYTFTSPEFPWNASLALMWSAVEVNVIITCACIPTLKPLVLRILSAVVPPSRGTCKHLESPDTFVTRKSSQRSGGITASSLTGRVAEHGLQVPPPAYRQAADNHRPEISMTGLVMASDWSYRADTVDSGPMDSTASSTIQNRNSYALIPSLTVARPKSTIEVSARQSLGYCTLVTIVFLFWGFTFGILNLFGAVLSTIAGMSTAQNLSLGGMYFGGGFFFGPLLVGQWLVRRDDRKGYNFEQGKPVGGFKATLITGLCIYGIGAMMFWPSSVLVSYPGFMLSYFVLGFGLGVLQTGITPFVILCGPAKYAEMRLCLAGGVLTTGSVLSGLLSADVLLADLIKHGRSNSTTLLNSQWTYLAITLVCAALALLFVFVPLPEVRQEELERATTENLAVDHKKRSIGGLRLDTVCLLLAILSMWTYFSGQVVTDVYVSDLMMEFGPPSTHLSATTRSSPSGMVPWLAISIPHYTLLARTAFAISRFIAGFVTYLHTKYPKCRFLPTPRTLISLLLVGCQIFGIFFITLRLHNANLLVLLIIGFYFCEGPIWTIAFAMGLRGQGKRTKRAGAFLVMSQSGPVVWFYVMYAIIERGGARVQIAFIVVIALLAVAGVYPLFLTLSHDAKTMTSPLSVENCRSDAPQRLRD